MHQKFEKSLSIKVQTSLFFFKRSVGLTELDVMERVSCAARTATLENWIRRDNEVGQNWK